ncbi:MAG: KEOPS complex subunit Pcc1 [Methanomicrobiales archaeon]|nr:KEOPS complex subunit Pcc1 [Methanomicrobiales archaeon]MDI6877063.1 KEOPS complex subunit Pcc1 [Methanomicrobiales archaeon]
MKRHTACFRFETPHAGRLYRVVLPESGGGEGSGRSSAAVALEGGALVLRVEASDISALRAALNMWLRLISVAEEMQEAARECLPPG